MGVGRRAVGAAARHLGPPRGGRRDGAARVLVGVPAGLDREALPDVVGARHLRRATRRDRGRLLPHLRRRLGQFPDARRCVVVVVMHSYIDKKHLKNVGQRRRSHRIIGGHKGRLGVLGTKSPRS